MTMTRPVRVEKRGGFWAVVEGLTGESIRVFFRREKAIEFAESLRWARHTGTELTEVK